MQCRYSQPVIKEEGYSQGANYKGVLGGSDPQIKVWPSRLKGSGVKGLKDLKNSYTKQI